MILGVDVSTYLEQIRIANSKYKSHGQEIDPFQRLKDNGVTHIRIRVWNDPYSEDGKPYLAGTCDMANCLALCQKLQPYGFKFVIDFHYSDFWCDPSKQFKPKAWANLSFDELKEALYRFTYDSLMILKQAHIDVSHVQIGNEITNGMLWPTCHIENGDSKQESYKRLSIILKEGIRALKEVFPFSLAIIHLERSFDQELYREYLNELKKNDVHFDVLGTSYYPFWHHSFDEYFANMDMIQNEFHIPVVNAELGYPFTTLDYRQDEEGKPKHLVINADNIEDFKKMMPFDCSISGQAEFIKAFLLLANKHRLAGSFYWEPLWIPGEGICWASEEGQAYQNSHEKDTRNEWANQCLFDYEGELLPAFDEFSIKNCK